MTKAASEMRPLVMNFSYKIEVDVEVDTEVEGNVWH